MKLPASPTPRIATMRGFSLIELMVTVAIMAILTTIAMNSYANYVLRSNRTEARLALRAAQAGEEKWFLQNNAYAQDVATLRGTPPAGLGIDISATGVTPGGKYTISFAVAAANSYTLQAVATGAQANDTAACRTLTIDQQGARTPADSTGCWK